MNNCIFCQIVKGKIPCFKVYEDKEFLGFLTIAPFSEGHSLIIPKKHYRWIWDIKEKGLDKAAKIVSQSLLKNTNSDFIAYYSEGMEVAHAHLHLIPRKVNDSLFSCEKPLSLSKDKMLKIAKKISANT